MGKRSSNARSIVPIVANSPCGTPIFAQLTDALTDTSPQECSVRKFNFTMDWTLALLSIHGGAVCPLHGQYFAIPFHDRAPSTNSQRRALRPCRITATQWRTHGRLPTYQNVIWRVVRVVVSVFEESQSQRSAFTPDVDRLGFDL